MSVTAVATLATDTLSAFGAQVLIVLSAVIGVAIAYYLFRFAWAKIKGTIHERKYHRDLDYWDKHRPLGMR